MSHHESRQAFEDFPRSVQASSRHGSTAPRRQPGIPPGGLTAVGKVTPAGVTPATVKPVRPKRGRPRKGRPSSSASGIYRGQSSLERQAERRERLLDTAIDLFGTAGYSASPIDMICAAAGVTARHFYQQFESREALLRAAYDAIIADTQRAVLLALAGAGTTEERISAGVRAFVHAYLDDPRRGRIACVEVVGISQDLERHRRSVRRAFASIIQAQAEALVAAGRLERQWDYDVAGVALMGGVNELIDDWISRRDKPPVGPFAEHVVTFFMVVIQGGATLRGREQVAQRG